MQRRTLNWSYDGVNRLTNESVAQDPAGRNGSVSYTLDPVGNRLAAASTLAGVASSSAAYSPDDPLSTESYDLNGNVLATGGRSFTYDSENRLVAMNGGAAGSQVAIQHDGWGNRVAETANGTTTRYLVDDLNPTGYPQVVEELVNGAVSRRYAYGFQRISETQLANNSWTPSFYGYDGMGSVRQLTSLSGAVTDTYSYDAFGNLLASTGSTFSQRLLFWLAHPSRPTSYSHAQVPILTSSQSIRRSAERLSRIHPVPLDRFTAGGILKWRQECTYGAAAGWVFASEWTQERCRPGRIPCSRDSWNQQHTRRRSRKKAAWHSFRHTYSTLLKGNGEDVKVVQELMRPRKFPDDYQCLYQSHYVRKTRRADPGRGRPHGQNRTAERRERRNRWLEPAYFRRISLPLDFL